ncbi:MAG: AEC family transporter [Candidatus Magasanikbacteria bacterium]|nr:AEC family transporter [Candidatus Magasanikbacteria bacterium]
MSQIFSIIAPLFLIIFVSAALQRWLKIGENWSQVLNDLALKIGLPVLIFSALAQTSFSFFEQSSLIISNSIFIIATFIFAFLLGKILRLENKMFRTFFLCLIFGNTAYLGIPVLIQILGEKILSSASLIVAIYLFWLFTIGIGFLEFNDKQKRKRDIFKTIFVDLVKNPLLIGVVLGILVASFKIILPAVLTKSLDMITASVTPTVLIVIGLFIGKSRIGKVMDWVPALLFSLATLIFLPAAFYFGVKFLGFSPSAFLPSIIQAAMPLAITPFALADKFGLHKEFIARSIVLSTILSVISLPFWISILHQI